MSMQKWVEGNWHWIAPLIGLGSLALFVALLLGVQLVAEGVRAL